MKFLLCLMLALTFTSPISQGEELSVISSICTLYQTADFTTPVLDQNEKEIVLSHGDKLTAVEENGDFVKVLTSDNNEGYVFKFYVTANKNGQDVYPVFNGKVISDSTEILNLDKTSSGHNAKLNQEIYIYGGFDSKKEFTEIAIVLEDGSLFYGLVKTKDIQAYGISSALVTAITIIIALVTVILAVVLIKKRKTAKK